jgi:hypothetical protein
LEVCCACVGAVNVRDVVTEERLSGRKRVMTRLGRFSCGSKGLSFREESRQRVGAVSCRMSMAELSGFMI